MLKAQCDHSVLNNPFRSPEALRVSHYGYIKLNFRKLMGVIIKNSMNEPFLHFFLALNQNAILVDPKV